MSGRNVVSMSAQARAAPQATQGQMMPMTAPWPMPPQGSYSGFPAGCCPPGGMDALMQCYCDIQAATAFISKVVQDLAANDPAFQQSLVDAIVASGSNIPLIGVTNGADAQPGQVGEWVRFAQTVSFPATAFQQTIVMGILQPGDWDCWAAATYTPSLATGTYGFGLNPVPPGFSDDLTSADAGGGETEISTVVRALLSVPTLIPMVLGTNGPAGSALLVFYARRRR